MRWRRLLLSVVVLLALCPYALYESRCIDPCVLFVSIAAAIANFSVRGIFFGYSLSGWHVDALCRRRYSADVSGQGPGACPNTLSTVVYSGTDCEGSAHASIPCYCCTGS